MSKDKLWIFLHLPKTGGTTFNGHLYKNFKWDEELILLNAWGEDYRREKSKLPFHERHLEERQKVKVIGGHNTYYGIHALVPGKEPRYITFLRDPAERCVSLYNYRRSKYLNVGFEDWYRDYFNNESKNSMSRFYFERVMPAVEKESMGEEELKTAKKLLDKCWLVGLTESLDKTLTFLCSELDINNDWKDYRVAGHKGDSLAGLEHPEGGVIINKHIKLDDEIRKLVYKDHPLDLELYRYSKTLSNEL